ncbi:uncharacterized protein LOC128964411 [Oppia nitens]|uniref:uncharacterized protein LOC128964411 n=1 Tax=Oppia nitens TaxID=1686743 RepID=UPI0023DA835F|nr:uncharacterized protein LOC128964411 [Oppia nitens]
MHVINVTNTTNDVLVTQWATAFESRQQSDSLLLELLPTLLGVAASGRLTPFLIPTLIKIVILPLLKIVNTISKVFIITGCFSYFITIILPLLLKYYGLMPLTAKSAENMY